MEDQERENSEEGAAATEKVIIIHQAYYSPGRIFACKFGGLIFGWTYFWEGLVIEI